MWKTAFKKLEEYGLLKQTTLFFKGYLPKILLGPFLNTLSHLGFDHCRSLLLIFISPEIIKNTCVGKLYIKIGGNEFIGGDQFEKGGLIKMFRTFLLIDLGDMISNLKWL